MQTKALQLNLKDLNMGKREVVVMHATYKTLDRDKDRSNRGMFDKSWKENSHLIRFFLNHDKTLAPGKVDQLWDDSEGAYTKAKLGTHTLGEDVLKMLDEGVIQAVSFGFLPVKVKEIKGKGSDLLEVQHVETSVLTHWGAHDDSRVVSVQKSLTNPEELKQVKDSISIMEKFIRNTTASDESIQAIEKELVKLKRLLTKNTDTANTDPSLIKCPKCATLSTGIEDEAGRIKCAECSHVLTSAGQPDASSDKSELRRKLLLLKSKMI